MNFNQIDLHNKTLTKFVEKGMGIYHIEYMGYENIYHGESDDIDLAL